MPKFVKELGLISAAALLAGALAGCQAVPTGPDGEPLSGVAAARLIEAPAPKVTPSVIIARDQIFAYDSTISVGTAFEQYGRCDPKTRLWEELEPGDVQFSCRFDDGTIIQFDFRVTTEPRKSELRMVTFTSMMDAEFAGISVRGPDAEDMLRKIYMNEKLF